MDVPFWIWAVFGAAVLSVLFVDLLVFHLEREDPHDRLPGGHSPGSASRSASQASSGPGAEAGGDPVLSGYLVERSLSLDNVFIFLIILAYFAVPSPYRHRALLWGVLGALVLRAAFIAVGAVALERFSWTVYVLGIFLIATGMRLAVHEVEAHRAERGLTPPCAGSCR